MKGNREGLDKLYAERFKLWRELVNISDFVRGSVVVLRRPCVYSNCRLCREGKKHPATYLSTNKKGKTRLVYLSKNIQSRVREWVENYRKLQAIIEKISDLNVEIMKLQSKRRGK